MGLEFGKGGAAEVDRIGTERVSPSLFERLDNRIDLVFADDGHGFEKDSNSDVRDVRTETLYSTEGQRIEAANRTSKDYMKWTSDVGDSKCMPNLETERGREISESMKPFKQDYVEYKDGVVDFAPFAVEEVVIGDMRDNLPYNYKQATEALANKWNKEGKDGRADWTAGDVKAWKAESQLEFHECSDMRTCQFVPETIHQAFRHSGGRMECGLRDGMRNGFDD